MSFLDYDSSPTAEAVSVDDSLKEESSFEQTIKRNIRRIRSNLLSLEESLHSLNSDCVSRRIAESLDSRLKETYSIVAETHHCFREWTIHFAGNPVEKQKHKFSYRKLITNFYSEIKRVQQLSNSVEEAAKRVAENRTFNPQKLESQIIEKTAKNYEGATHRPTRPWNSSQAAAQNDSHANSVVLMNGEEEPYQKDMVEITELDDVTEHEALITGKIAEERLNGLNRIQGQVIQAHQAIRDLASLVFQQDSELETIEGHLDYSTAQSAKAVEELEKSYNTVHRKRRRRLAFVLICAFAFFFLFWFLILPTFPNSYEKP